MAVQEMKVIELHSIARVPVIVCRSYNGSVPIVESTVIVVVVCAPFNRAGWLECCFCAMWCRYHYIRIIQAINTNADSSYLAMAGKSYWRAVGQQRLGTAHEIAIEMEIGRIQSVQNQLFRKAYEQGKRWTEKKSCVEAAAEPSKGRVVLTLRPSDRQIVAIRLVNNV